MLAATAQLDNEVRAARCKSGMTSRAAEGRWTHKPPLGYRPYPLTKDARRRRLPADFASIVFDPRTADAVRRAFVDAARGKELSTVRRDAEMSGVHGRSGKLSADTFRAMLRSPSTSVALKQGLRAGAAIGNRPSIVRLGMPCNAVLIVVVTSRTRRTPTSTRWEVCSFTRGAIQLCSRTPRMEDTERDSRTTVANLAD